MKRDFFTTTVLSPGEYSKEVCVVYQTRPAFESTVAAGILGGCCVFIQPRSIAGLRTDLSFMLMKSLMQQQPHGHLEGSGEAVQLSRHCTLCEMSDWVLSRQLGSPASGCRSFPKLEKLERWRPRIVRDSSEAFDLLVHRNIATVPSELVSGRWTA